MGSAFRPGRLDSRGESSFAVRHFHQRRLSLSTLSLNELELAVSRSGLYFPLAEVTGNVWLAESAQVSPRR